MAVLFVLPVSGYSVKASFTKSFPNRLLTGVKRKAKHMDLKCEIGREANVDKKQIDAEELIELIEEAKLIAYKKIPEISDNQELHMLWTERLLGMQTAYDVVIREIRALLKK